MRALRPGSKAELFLDGLCVGTVRVRRQNGSWGFGYFEPTAHFARFASVFGTWSLLMHADDDDDELSRAAAEELRSVEAAMDQVRARMHLPDDRWIELAQVNIDGQLIEWKEG